MSKKKRQKYKSLESLCQEILVSVLPVWDQDVPVSMQQITRFYIDQRLVYELKRLLTKPTK